MILVKKRSRLPAIAGTSALDRIRSRARTHSGVDAEKVGCRVSPMLEMKVHEPPAGKAKGPVEIEAVANTPTVDLDDEVVVPSGLDPSIHLRYRSIYYNHLYGSFCDGGEPILPIGSLRYATLTDQGSAWRIRFAVASNPFALDVLTGIREGIIRGVSIGFAREDFGPPTEEELNEYGPHEFITRRGLWLETSATPMPCNPDALIQGVTMDDDGQRSIAHLVERGRISAKSAQVMTGKNLITSRNVPLTPAKRRVIIMG